MKSNAIKEKSVSSAIRTPFKAVGNAYYDLSVAVRAKKVQRGGVKIRNLSTAKRKDLIYYILMMAWPVLHFCVFYLAVNVNSIALAFKTYLPDGDFAWHGFKNFARVFNEIGSSSIIHSALGNSFMVWAALLVTGLPLALLFSFFIYKKMPLSSIFRFVLFVPQIVSSIVMVIVFSYFVERALPQIFDLFGVKIPMLLSKQETSFAAVIFYNFWLSFAGRVLIYTSVMNGVSPDVVEAAKLDGARPLREFIHVALPHCWPMLVMSLTGSVAGIMGNGIYLYEFYSTAAEPRMYTFGYFMFMRTLTAGQPQYPYLAAFGVVLTLIMAPLTLGVKALLEKFGPNED
jgi:ABC-type sugar transport system permease subunit